MGALSFSLLRILSRISGLEVTLSVRAIVEIVNQLRHFTMARRSYLPRLSFQERQQEIRILRLFMMCHSGQKLEL
uniref:Uncharacterized protein n=1 Tax=Solanum tuberosum TaxID=4113 RepID=M0ZM95_SOLTU